MKYYQTNYWKKKSKDYLQRFPVCEICRLKPSKHVHHRKYGNFFKEKYWDLLALCIGCHLKQHKTLLVKLSGKRIHAPMMDVALRTGLKGQTTREKSEHAVC